MRQSIILSFFCLLCSFQLWSQQSKVNPLIYQELAERGATTVILNFEPLYLQKLIPEHLSKIEKGRLAFELLTNHNQQQMQSTRQLLGRSAYNYKILDLTSSIVVYQCDAQLLSKLKSINDILSIEYNYHIKSIQPIAHEGAKTARSQYTWGVGLTGADKVQESGIKGQGVVIAGNDTGFEWTHPAITNKYRGAIGIVVDHNYNWHDGIHENSPLSDPNSSNPCGLSTTQPCDDHSHGTHTMGTMVGYKPEDDLVLGMAPEALWIGARNMERGNGSFQSYLETFNWFFAPTDINDANPNPDMSPHVINNSWYCSEEEGCNSSNWNAVHLAVSNLKAAGIVVVVAAGNSGPGCNTIAFVPSMSPDAFAVGATDNVDTIARFSSRGLVTADGSMLFKPDVSAPGVGVYSSVLNNGYNFSSGTSMAAPHVAGLVALMISANPLIAGHVDTIQQIIKISAVPLTIDQTCNGLSGLEVPNPVYGHGRINALAAVELAKMYSPPIKTKTNSTVGGLHIYPNPAIDYCIINTNDGTPIQVITVLDAMGRKVLTSKVSEGNQPIKINTANLPNGTYYIQAQTEQGIGIQQLSILK